MDIYCAFEINTSIDNEKQVSWCFTLNRCHKGSFSSLGIAPHDGQGDKKCCLIDRMMAWESTLEGTNLNTNA